MRIFSLIIALMMSTVVGTLEARAADGGYWRCEAKKWIPVGEPKHTMPRKI